VVDIQTGYRVCDVMVRKPIAVSPDASVKEAANLMKKHDVGSLVVNENDKLVGYITEQEIVHKVVARGLDPNKKKVKHIVNQDVKTVGPNTDIYDALKKMARFGVRQMPVVDRKKLVGLLTQKTILKVQPQLFELVAEKIELKEEHRKAIFGQDTLEGTCDLCGMFSENIKQVSGQFVCERCVGSVE
jgi:CBS domain-containing protein